MPRPRRVDPPLPSPTTLPSFAPASFYSITAATTTSTSAPSSRNHKRELRVLLYDKPRYHVQSHTTPRPPIALVPPRDDDDAFIVDKVVTPLDWGGPPAVGTAADLGLDLDDDEYDTDEEEAKENERYRQDPRRQHVKRVLNYVVGWPDEPYARQLVPCTQILDYVSPRVLEDWEYALTERQRAAREARLAEKVEKAAEAAAKKKGHRVKHEEEDVAMGAEDLGPATTQLKKKNPGRPPQTAAATAARVAAAAARAAAAREAAAKGLPSTPTKTAKMAPTPGGPADRTTRTTRPGSSLTARSTLTGLQIQLDSTPMTVSIGGPPPPNLLSSPASEKLHAGPSLKRPFQKFVEQQVTDESESRGASLGIDTTTTTNTSTNEEEEDEVADSDEKEDELQRPVIRPPQMGMLPSLRGTPPVQQKPSQQPPPPRAPTYIPPPDVPLHKQPQKQPNSTGPAPITPIPLPPTAAAIIPIPPATQAQAQVHASLKRKRSEETPIPPPPIPTTHQAAAAQETIEMQADPEEEEQDLYEVDRLEGDWLTAVDEEGNAIVDEDADMDHPPPAPPHGSRVVRLFLVRWKGDWPPDQNPTWEPAENLPPRMVRQYLKRAAQKQVGGGNRGTGKGVEGKSGS